MARTFTSTDAKRLVETHADYLSRLQEGEGASGRYRSDISRAANDLAAREASKILRGIPVEEINRNKRGLRVKALRESGYSTIADLYAASVYNIAAVHGISEDGAHSIKWIANNLAEQAVKGVKIRLSTDDKTPQSTSLVTAISRFRQSLPNARKCHQLVERHGREIRYAIEDLAPARSGLRWLFTSKAKKNKAQEAYDLLKDLLSGTYGQDARAALLGLDAAERLNGAEAWDDFSENSVGFFNVLEEVAPGLLGNEDAQYGLPEELAREVQEESFFPDGLLCELRRYQEWGVKYILHQERVLLGDEMGLGKTVQAIAAMVSLRNTGATHFMVVCPASVLENWCREIRKHSRLSVTKVHGSGKNSALRSWVQSGGVAVTTYETTNSFKLTSDFSFSMLTVDEAHYIKNPKARRTISVKKVAGHAERLLFMTGTALENNVDEMIELISILRPNIARRLRPIASISNAPKFRETIAPVYYRRKREDVLTELPELIESREWCTLRREEKAVYERAVLARSFVGSRRVSWSVNDLSTSSKATRMLELVGEAESGGRKVIVFSFFLDTIRKVSTLLGPKATNPITGSVSPQRRQEIVDDFERASAGTVLPAQILAGGTGLNIQSASVVIICEPQLKPSIENQAISRAYRMGQTRNVLVYRLLCENTIDERITELLERKQADFDAFADVSVAAKESIELDEKTLGNLIEEEIERVNAEKDEAAS